MARPEIDPAELAEMEAQAETIVNSKAAAGVVAAVGRETVREALVANFWLSRQLIQGGCGFSEWMDAIYLHSSRCSAELCPWDRAADVLRRLGLPATPEGGAEQN